MSTRLDVPDGMQVTAVTDPDGPMLEFYTGRWEIRYNRSEVMGLMDALNGWLNKTQEEAPR